MNTRKYPRSLVEAFGPYSSGPIEPMREPVQRRRPDWALYTVAVILVVMWIAGAFA